MLLFSSCGRCSSARETDRVSLQGVRDGQQKSPPGCAQRSGRGSRHKSSRLGARKKRYLHRTHGTYGAHPKGRDRVVS